MRFASLCSSLLFCSLANPLPAQIHPEGEAVPQSLNQLMQRMATTRRVKAKFHEVKQLALLAAPLESRGLFYFISPDCLAWHTTHPGSSLFAIEGTSVRFRDETGTESIDLSRDPSVRAFVDSFMVLFKGDLEALQSSYHVSFDSDASGWRLVLTPRAARMKQVVSEIRLSGKSGPLQEMELREADGDRTTTTFEEIEIGHSFDAADIGEIFDPRARCGRH